MENIEVIKIPKYIVYDGNLYELIDTNVPLVFNYDEAINIAKQEKDK